MPTDYLVSGTDLTAVADAIRTVGDTNANLEFPNGFVSAINAIGVKRPEADENDVILIDFDGRILYSYTAAQFAQLEALPTIPVIKYSFLQQDGWNWTLADAKAYVAKYGELVIGAQYTAKDGKNHMLIDIPSSLSWYIQILIANAGASSGNSITIDWGDGSETTTETGIGRNVTKSYSHTYASAGEYDIKWTCTSGYAMWQASDSRYRAYIKAATYGPITGDTSFSSVSFMYGTYDIILLTGWKRTVQNQAQYHRTHGAYIFPRDFIVTAGNSNWFTKDPATGVKYVSWSKGVSQAAAGYVYQNCRYLQRITFPEEVTALGANTLYQARSLRKLTIPVNVTSIATKALYGCTGLREIHFYPTTPPTVDAADAFESLSTSCVIYVPTGKLTDYTTASNYPDSATYTYVEE